MSTRIESLGVYVPEGSLGTDEVLAGCARPVKFPLEQMTGIRSRPVAAKGELAIDLAEAAATRCLARSRYAAREIDLLICCTMSRYDEPDFGIRCEPSTALVLAPRLGLRSDALALDVGNACAGIFTGILVADALLATGRIDRALVVSGEHITHLLRTAQHEIDSYLDDRLACLTLGDAGAALVLDRSPDPRVGFSALELYTLGRHSHYCTAVPTRGPHGGAVMHTDSVRLTAVGTKQAVHHATSVLDRIGLAPEALGHIVMHQTSRTSLAAAVREINALYGRRVCHGDNVVDNLATRGNTATTSHWVAIADHPEKWRDDETALFSVTGSGITIGTAVYRFDDLPSRLIDPARRASTAATSEGAATAEEVHVTSVGVARPDASTPAETFALAEAAALRCLREARLSPSDVGVLIFAGVYRTGFLAEPAIAAMLAGRLGMNDEVGWDAPQRTLAFDVHNGGTGMLDGVAVARALLGAGRARHALVVGAEVENNVDAFPDDATRWRGIAPSAGAILLSTGPGEARARVTHVAHRLFREHAPLFGARLAQRDGHTFVRRAPEGPHARAAFDAALLASVVETAAAALDRWRITPDTLTATVLPQRGAAFVREIARRLGLREGVATVVAETEGELLTSSLAFGLASLGPRAFGGPVLLVDAGAGIHVSVALLTTDGDS